MHAQLEKMVSTQKVPHSLLFTGGTREDAITFAKEMLGESHLNKIDSGNHPDLHFFAPEGKSHLHSMASMQNLIAEMAMPPFEAPYKFFIIEEAHQMLPSSSNALLKTLEEPPEDTYFILLSDRPSYLMPTILSRLSPISFSLEETDAGNVTPFLKLAQTGEWDTLLDRLCEIEDLDPEALFRGLLESIRDPDAFTCFAPKIAEAQKALHHNVKLRNVFFNLLLEISSDDPELGSLRIN